jgi:hypothetical protein
MRGAPPREVHLQAHQHKCSAPYWLGMRTPMAEPTPMGQFVSRLS